MSRPRGSERVVKVTLLLCAAAVGVVFGWARISAGAAAATSTANPAASPAASAAATAAMCPTTSAATEPASSATSSGVASGDGASIDQSPDTLQDVRIADDVAGGLLPRPQHLEVTGPSVRLDAGWRIVLDTADPDYAFAAQWLNEKVVTDVPLALPVDDGAQADPAPRRVVIGDPSAPSSPIRTTAPSVGCGPRALPTCRRSSRCTAPTRPVRSRSCSRT
jgi:hypothetical protein